MLRYFKGVSRLAILSFILVITFLLYIFLVEFFDLAMSDTLDIVMIAYLPFFAVVLGIMSLISIIFKYNKTRKWDRYLLAGIILSILSILVGGFFSLLMLFAAMCTG